MNAATESGEPDQRLASRVVQSPDWMKLAQ
jgi:hypothetical protein